MVEISGFLKIWGCQFLGFWNPKVQDFWALGLTYLGLDLLPECIEYNTWQNYQYCLQPEIFHFDPQSKPKFLENRFAHPLLNNIDWGIILVIIGIKHLWISLGIFEDFFKARLFERVIISHFLPYILYLCDVFKKV